jgi:hypothetical protein
LKELSLHILDIIQNSIEAGASKIEINIEENLETDLFQIEVSDNGKGMAAEQIARILDPFYTTRKTRHIGLGLPLFLEACRRCEGDLKIRSKPGSGTTLQAVMRHSHIDRAPLGDMPSVLITILQSAKPLDWMYHHRVNGEEFRLDSSEIRRELEDVPLTHPKVRQWLMELLVEGESSLDLKNLPQRAKA